MAKILLIEDDLELAEGLKSWFTEAGYLLEHAPTGEDGLQLLNNFEYDIILLDWMLPGISGVEVCKQFRKAGGKTIVIFLTGQGEVDHIETGLDAGADDYLLKPFNIRELAARIRSLQRRPATFRSDALTIDNLVLDPVRHIMTVDGTAHQLTPKESALLEFLLRNPNRPCHSQTLLDAIWPSDGSGSVEAVRTWMRNLRKKLELAGKGELIKTTRGHGYVIESKQC